MSKEDDMTSTRRAPRLSAAQARFIAASGEPISSAAFAWATVRGLLVRGLVREVRQPAEASRYQRTLTGAQALALSAPELF